MTTTQAAKLKGVSRQCIVQAIRRGAIKARKTQTQRGPVWDVDPADLAAWTPGPPPTKGRRPPQLERTTP